MNIKSLALAATIGFGSALAGAAPASALTFGFDNITNNNATNAAIGESQLAMEVTQASAGFVTFKFTNAVGFASSITDIYFDDSAAGPGLSGPPPSDSGIPGVLASLFSIADSGDGVAFTALANPGELPGGNDFDFNVSPIGASADSDPAAQPNGVNSASEWVAITFSLLTGVSFDNVIAALGAGGPDAGLRVGLHVQGFANSGSESFINNPNGGGGISPIPLPAAVWMLIAAVGGLGLMGHRRRASV